MSASRLFLIDATALCYRAFYALQNLSTSYGQPTNAVYGFHNILLKLLREQKPRYLAVCFDVSRETFRTKKYAEYKSNRPPMPDGLSSQMALIHELLEAYGLKVFERKGYEADDIIASLISAARAGGMASTVISSDKDLLQLVADDVSVLSPQKDEDMVYGPAEVRAKYGIEPGQIADMLALTGDAVDNIPGIQGITEKKALELVKEFGSVENLLKNTASLPEKIRPAVEENSRQIRLNRELAQLDAGIKLDASLEGLKVPEPDREKLFALFKRLEFRTLLKELAVPGEKEQVKVETLLDHTLEGMFKPGDEVFVAAGEDATDLVFGPGEKFFRCEGTGANLKAFLADRAIKKTGHDLKRIKTLLARQGIAFEGCWFDTMIAAYLLNPSRGDYSLEETAWDYTEKHYTELMLDPAAAALLAARLKPLLEKELKAKELEPLFRSTEMPLVEVLADMENDGIRLDLDLLKELSVDLEKRLKKLVSSIYKMAETEFNINSPLQLRQVLFEKLKLPVYKKTKTGPSTDEEVLHKLADKHEIVAFLLEYRQLTKLKSTYIDALPQLVDPKTGKVHTSFKQTGTETGRLSSINPNLQNIPVKTDLGRKIRAAVIPFDDKSVMLSCDYSQIELRILAHMSRDEALMEAFKQGKDIHLSTAAAVNGLDEDDVSDELRNTAKAVNFGIVYGLSAYGLARQLGTSQVKAQEFIDAYFARYPGVQRFIQDEIASAEKTGFVTTILGRRRYLPEINSKTPQIKQLAERQAMNTPIQGSASDLIKCAMVRIHEEMRKGVWKARMLLQIHDELLFTVPLKELKPFALMVREHMEHVLSLAVPIKVDIKSGKNWCDTEPLAGLEGKE
jgi:DNA polymerase-1